MKTSYRLRGKSLQIMYVKYLYQEYKTQSSVIRKPNFKKWAKDLQKYFTKEHMSVSCSVVSNSLQPHGLSPTRFLCPWGSPGKNTKMSCHALLQRIFLTQGSNPDLHCRQFLYHLSHMKYNPNKQAHENMLSIFSHQGNANHYKT